VRRQAARPALRTRRRPRSIWASAARGQQDARRVRQRQILANWAGVDLTRINGLGVAAVMKILSEIGPDMSRFASVKHFCSWLGLCPGTKISGGKVLSSKTKRSANRVRQALKMAAMSLSHSDSALGAFYAGCAGRMDKPRANTATAHKLARMVYFMLTRGEAYVDQGQQHYEEQQRQRSIAALKRRAAALGFALSSIWCRPWVQKSLPWGPLPTGWPWSHPTASDPRVKASLDPGQPSSPSRTR
jgi:hypothetical protein